MNDLDKESVDSSEEECDSDPDIDEETEALSNARDIEVVFSSHRVACMDQKYTRLPCSAHKVPLYFQELNITLSLPGTSGV